MLRKYFILSAPIIILILKLVLIHNCVNLFSEIHFLEEKISEICFTKLIKFSKDKAIIFNSSSNIFEILDLRKYESNNNENTIYILKNNEILKITEEYLSKISFKNYLTITDIVPSEKIVLPNALVYQIINFLTHSETSELRRLINLLFHKIKSFKVPYRMYNLSFKTINLLFKNFSLEKAGDILIYKYTNKQLGFEVYDSQLYFDKKNDFKKRLEFANYLGVIKKHINLFNVNKFDYDNYTEDIINLLEKKYNFLQNIENYENIFPKFSSLNKNQNFQNIDSCFTLGIDISETFLENKIMSSKNHKFTKKENHKMRKILVSNFLIS